MRFKIDENLPVEVDAKFILVADAPARACLETGERFFAPETVEHLQQTIENSGLSGMGG